MSTDNDTPVALKTDSQLLNSGIMDKSLVPGVSAEMVSYKEANAIDRTKIETLMREIDLENTNSIIFFGSKAQEKLTTISDNMLEKVKSKDAGTAGEALSSMVATIRGFDVEQLNPNRKPGFFERLLGKATPVVKFLQKYEEVRKQIDLISVEMETHKTQLLTDITSLDRLYDANLDYFHTLELYIAAGEERLRQLDEKVIPAREQER